MSEAELLALVDRQNITIANLVAQLTKLADATEKLIESNNMRDAATYRSVLKMREALSFINQGTEDFISELLLRLDEDPTYAAAVVVLDTNSEVVAKVIEALDHLAAANKPHPPIPNP